MAVATIKMSENTYALLNVQYDRQHSFRFLINAITFRKRLFRIFEYLKRPHRGFLESRAVITSVNRY